MNKQKKLILLGVKRAQEKRKKTAFFCGINLTVIVLEDPHEVTEVPDEPAHDLEWKNMWFTVVKMIEL